MTFWRKDKIGLWFFKLKSWSWAVVFAPKWYIFDYIKSLYKCIVNKLEMNMYTLVHENKYTSTLLEESHIICDLWNTDSIRYSYAFLKRVRLRKSKKNWVQDKWKISLMKGLKALNMNDGIFKMSLWYGAFCTHIGWIQMHCLQNIP